MVFLSDEFSETPQTNFDNFLIVQLAGFEQLVHNEVTISVVSEAVLGIGNRHEEGLDGNPSDLDLSLVGVDVVNQRLHYEALLRLVHCFRIQVLTDIRQRGHAGMLQICVLRGLGSLTELGNELLPLLSGEFDASDG